MPLGAMSLRGILPRPTNTANYIFLMRDRFKMIYTDTADIPAQVIEF